MSLKLILCGLVLLDLTLCLLYPHSPLKDEFLAFWLDDLDFGLPYELVSVVVRWTWFHSGLVEVSPSLDGELRGDVSPTPPK